MKVFVPALSLAALLGVAACAGNTTRPTDTGSMQLPPTTSTGSVVARPPAGPDVGSMTAPSGMGGVVTRTQNTRSVPDTGNMALPSRAQGNSLPQ